MEENVPIIGVTGPDRGGEAVWWFTRFIIWLAGGHAVRITPRHPRTMEHLHGLIVGGGADVDPTLYTRPDERVLARKRPPDEPRLLFLLELALFPIIWIARTWSGLWTSPTRDLERDRLEWELIDQASRRRLPILGICRGEQLLNVYFGGSLHRELRSFYVEDPDVRSILPRKTVLIVEGTRLEKLMGRRPRRVNALHSQAIARLGEGLIISARDRNGIVQAIEHEDAPFIVGVQWHPEFLPQLPEQRALFRGLVHHARRRRQSEHQRLAA